MRQLNYSYFNQVIELLSDITIYLKKTRCLLLENFQILLIIRHMITTNVQKINLMFSQGNNTMMAKLQNETE